MSATEYNRWYITPTAETTAPGTPGGATAFAPKYVHGDTRLNGYSGEIVGRSVLTAYAGLLDQFPDQDRWYLIRVYATGNTGYQALNELSANHQDTRTLATNQAFVADVLNQRTGLDRTAAEWEQSFRIGPRSASE